METLDSSDTGKMFRQDRGGFGVSKLFVSLVVIAIILSSVALVVAFISLSQNGGVSTISFGGQQESSPKDDKIWNIAVGHSRYNDIYIDPQSGQLKGFDVDIINAVCGLANKNCRLVYDVWQRCWDSETGQMPRGGVGLMSGWYDACAGWLKGHARARTFQFSKPWQTVYKFRFIVKTGNPNGFNPTDVTNVKFGFVDGFINDEFCIARQTTITGSTLPSSQIVHYAQPTEMYDAVLSGEVDVCFAVGDLLPDGLTRLEDPVIDCSLESTGKSLMLRMDNSLLEWWDPALERLMQTSEYHDICQNINDEHGHMPGRGPEDICLGY